MCCCAKQNFKIVEHTMYANAEGRLFFWQMQGFEKPAKVKYRSCLKCGAQQQVAEQYEQQELFN